MRTLGDAKAMAKTLRRDLSEWTIDVSPSDCLELIARQFGVPEWNTPVAMIHRKPNDRTLRLPDGWIVDGSRSDAYDIGGDETERAALIRCKYAVDDPRFSDKAINLDFSKRSRRR